MYKKNSWYVALPLLKGGLVQPLILLPIIPTTLSTADQESKNENKHSC